MDQHRARSRRGRALGAVAVLAIATAAVGIQEFRSHGGHGAGHPPRSLVSHTQTLSGAHPGAHQDAEAFVAALRVGDRAGALRHGTATVYDALLRDEAGDTGRAQLQDCVRSAGDGAGWTCGVDFPSSGPADGEAYSLLVTWSGSHWSVTTTAPVAG